MWTVKVHTLVVEEDFKKISKQDRGTILKTVYKKLGTAPEKYGAPLRFGLKGYRKLRISHYRVIYKIEKQLVRVMVLKVGMRRDEQAYREMLKRLDKI